MRAVVASFEGQDQARRAADELRKAGIGERQVLVLRPGAADREQAESSLADVGVADAQARFYRSQLEAGRTLLAVLADEQAERAREILLGSGGEDVLQEGAELAGGTSAETRRAAPIPPPADITTRWEDVADRYRTLFGQRYGATDARWAEYEPAYRLAWSMAHTPDVVGRPWDDVQATVRREWEALGRGRPWQDVSGGMSDVWTDVARDARRPREGGVARNTSGPALDDLNHEVPPIRRSPLLDRLVEEGEDRDERPREATHQIGSP